MTDEALKRLKQEVNMEEEILLNIMFTGTYLEDKNIGHEVINLLKDDNGDNYIYVLPYGAMGREHNNKIKTIILVRRCSSKVFEIIAKATDLEQITYLRTNLNSKEKLYQHEKQIEYLDEHNITYGGLKPYKIFEKNVGNDESMYITFKANSLLKVAKPIYITTDKSKANKSCYFMKDIKNFPSQSPKMYIKNGLKSYDVLMQIVHYKDNWIKVNRTPTVQKLFDNKKDTQQVTNNFIDIIKKEDDELVFSNLFKYIFDANPSAFCKFAKDVLDISDFSDNFTIFREQANIDLLIASDAAKSVIVIENKIKSGINGTDDRHNIASKHVQSQLAKYHKYINETCKEYKNYKKKNKHYYIFAPDYNHIEIKKYECGKFYKLIEFSKIAQFFEKNKASYKNVPYFNEFLYALQKHTKSINSHHEEVMYKRFINEITTSSSQK